MVHTFAHFSVFARGRILGMRQAGARLSDIRDKVRKKDGKRANPRTIRALLEHAAADPS